MTNVEILEILAKYKIIESAVAVGLYVLAKKLINKNIERIVATEKTSPRRSALIKKATNISALLLLAFALFSIHGIDRSELGIFIGSVLTVLGIAFFAQWSILSNITAGVIIFFYHSVKLEDKLVIMDKDYEIEGNIHDIGLFFIILKVNDDYISIPNSIFLYKMIKKVKRK